MIRGSERPRGCQRSRGCHGQPQQRRPDGLILPAGLAGLSLLALGFLAGCSGEAAGAEAAGTEDGEPRITQIDSSRILPSQELDVYVRRPGGSGGAAGEDLRILEAGGPEKQPVELPVLAWEPLSGREEEISLSLLLDNSGSMYFPLEEAGGDREEGQTRMEAARRAVRYFLDEWSGYQDSLSLAAFNRDFNVLQGPTDSRSAVQAGLGRIEEPQGVEGFTELYESLWLTAEDYGDRGGRKVVILLSDGDNYPYAEHMEEPHPEFGSRLRTSQEVIEKFRREEVSLFAVSFGDEGGDEALGEMCAATGGLVFDAADEEELRGAYSTIRGEVAREFRAVCRASTLSAEKKWVTLADSRGRVLDQKPYWMPLLFGERALVFTMFPFLAFLLALAGRWGLARYPWRKAPAGRQLKVIHCSGGEGLHQEIPLEKPHTSIGWRDEDDMTLSGEGPEDPDEHVDIFYDQESGLYQLKSPRSVRVNNQLTTERTLHGGDVISIDGTSIVIDLEDSEPSA